MGVIIAEYTLFSLENDKTPDQLRIQFWDEKAVTENFSHWRVKKLLSSSIAPPPPPPKKWVF